MVGVNNPLGRVVGISRNGQRVANTAAQQTVGRYSAELLPRGTFLRDTHVANLILR